MKKLLFFLLVTFMGIEASAIGIAIVSVDGQDVQVNFATCAEATAFCGNSEVFSMVACFDFPPLEENQGTMGSATASPSINNEPCEIMTTESKIRPSTKKTSIFEDKSLC